MRKCMFSFCVFVSDSERVCGREKSYVCLCECVSVCVCVCTCLCCAAPAGGDRHAPESLCVCVCVSHLCRLVKLKRGAVVSGDSGGRVANCSFGFAHGSGVLFGHFGAVVALCLDQNKSVL